MYALTNIRSQELEKQGTVIRPTDWSDLLSTSFLTLTSSPTTTNEAFPAPYTAYVHVGPLLNALVPKAVAKAAAAAARKALPAKGSDAPHEHQGIGGGGKALGGGGAVGLGGVGSAGLGGGGEGLGGGKGGA